ncbi:hypothetical protein B0T26DRAFT_730107 [Lasiosphaeria miniovina]|uniref:Uncharacterized protein n=1 Tax=Lasiosphaeria miniovina TaxID=1954250 RepID=A0AA39ZTC5_9PEZI|nr:uncharacterized protein B0T26DRAFT_730107 [Lasiosphaeria miniovina]KAK0703185.1 hypothetical protein B0T26DRAFT_730107 [Lasiosphaeria miniovina]
MPESTIIFTIAATARLLTTTSLSCMLCRESKKMEISGESRRLEISFSISSGWTLSCCRALSTLHASISGWQPSYIGDMEHA